GTNDLIQYTFAADRMNESVSYLYQPFHPSIIKQLKMVIDASHEAGIWTGMCGEMAQEFKALPILLGLGLDEFSMSPSSVLKSRDEIRKMSFEKTKSMVEEILQYEDSKSVLNRLEANDFYG
uniref:putative PEP-binding protein n=1 Tax=Methanocalculus natronophilus TaxID=1262400 RepID=UPI0031B5F11B